MTPLTGAHGLTRAPLSRCSCGVVESVRLRSVAVDPEAKVPLRAAVLTGQRNAAVESVNGYVVFQSADGEPFCSSLFTAK